MTITLKCKMCGGALELDEKVVVCECEYCGTKQTLPKLNDEKKTALFERANQWRAQSEFDKAAVIYENILQEAPDEAEAYWGLCLCRYGIEYVEDPRSKKRVPTCHRAQFKSILEDSDYLSAIQHADLLARDVYRSEAEYIDKVQKGILAISAKEEPFDIFICYKESDENGDRTRDSVIAQDMYDQLTEKGFKVFFARITLEDKLGSAYEPYIFAALNSAKVMLVVGTKPEYFNAVWVKNEWSRYLSLIEQGQKKAVIPCYRDMAITDMPKEFTVLQSLDISKLGYMQDLLRGIDKILGVEKKKTAQPQQPVAAPQPAATAMRPSLISSVISVPANNGDDTFPKNPISSTINKDRYPAVAFHATLYRAVGFTGTVPLTMTVLDEMDNVVHSSTSEISVRPDNDKFSKVWLLRGSDGSSVADGIYRVRISVQGSEERECKFRVISNGTRLNPNNPTYINSPETAKPKKLGVYLLLCFFLGMFGIHSFYAGKIFKGIAQLFFTITGGGAWVTAIWCFIDFLKAVFKRQVPQKKK